MLNSEQIETLRRNADETPNHGYPTFPESGPSETLGMIGHAFTDIDQRIDGISGEMGKLGVADIHDATDTGRALMTATDEEAAREAIGAGTSSFDGAYTSLTGVPTEFTPAPHTHVMADITDLQPAMDLKADKAAIPTVTTIEGAGEAGRAVIAANTVQDAVNALGLTSVYKYKGSVADNGALPEEAEPGDVYNVESDGMNYAWNGTAWDALGMNVTLAGLGVTATAADLNMTAGVTSNIQTQLDAKADASAIADMETKTHAAETYQPKGDYATTTAMNDALALKQDAATAFDGRYTSLTEVPSEFTPKAHTHVMADITDLQDALDAKMDASKEGTFQPKGDYATTDALADMETRTNAAATYATKAEVAAKADATAIEDMLTNTEAAEAYQPKGEYVTADAIADMETKTEAASTYATKGELAAKQDAATAFDGKYTSLTEVPSQFTPAAHTHVIADVTGLQGALDAKADTSAIPTIPGNATASEAGLMSAEDKTKLDGLNNYVLPEATTDVLGGVKVGAGLTVQDGKLTTSTESKTFANPEVIGASEALDLSTATNGVYSINGGSITGLTGSNESAAALVVDAGATHPSALAFDGAFAADKVLPVCQDGTTWFKLTAMDRAEFVPDPAGDTVTKEEFIALRDALVAAGIMKSQA